MRAMLFEENVLVLSPQLAVAVGLHEAIVLQQMHYWLKKSKNIVDGKPWIYNTAEEWAEQFPFWKPDSIRKVFGRLRKAELIESRKLSANSWDKTNYYTIQYAQLEALGVLFSPATGTPDDGGGNPDESGSKPTATDAARNAASKRKKKNTDAAQDAASNRHDEPHRNGTTNRIDPADQPASLTETTTETTTETSTDTLPGQAPDGAKPGALEGELIEKGEQDSKGGLTPTPKPEPRVEIPADMPGPKDPNCKTYKAWVNYAYCYHRKYNCYPIWDAAAGNHLGKLIDRLGAEEAPKVAAFYLTVDDQFITKKGHDLPSLLRDLQSIRTQYLTGRRMNSTIARQIEATGANVNAAHEAARMIMDGGMRNEFI